MTKLKNGIFTQKTFAVTLKQLSPQCTVKVLAETEHKAGNFSILACEYHKNKTN